MTNTMVLSRLHDDDLERLLLIRHFELTLLDLFAQGQFRGTTHTCLGQEYIPVALNPLLQPDDFVFSNHRGHGHYLARFTDPAGLLAEIMGREGGICSGVGGSQHIYRRGYLSTGVQGQSLPIAVGVALHLKRTVPGTLVAVYIGDGTWGEGSVYEALNIALLWQVPLLVVVENNHIAQSTPTRLQMAGTIEQRARAFDITYMHVTSTDVNAIRLQIGPPIAQLRAAGQPLVIEFDTVRLGPHSKGDDTRDSQELEEVQMRDWYAVYRRQFAEQSGRIEAQVRSALREVVDDVVTRGPSRWEGR